MIYCCELLIRITARNEVVGVTAPAYKAINGMGGKEGRKNWMASDLMHI